MSDRSDCVHANRVEEEPGAMPRGQYYSSQLSIMPAQQQLDGEAMALQGCTRIHRIYRDAQFALHIPGTLYADNGAHTVVISLVIVQQDNQDREPLALTTKEKTSISKTG